MGETSWAFLLLGSFAAVGAAMALGTLAAIIRYHRTGVFPGAIEAASVTRGKYVALWARVGIGVVLTVAGIFALERAGLV